MHVTVFIIDSHQLQRIFALVHSNITIYTTLGIS